MSKLVVDVPGDFIPSFARGLDILVVDDDIPSLVHLTWMLEQYTFKVTTCDRACAALAKIQQESGKYKLVMASVNMPDIEGHIFLKELVETDVPVILVAQERNVRAAIQALNLGASFYLDKPIGMEDLKYVWQHAFRKRKREEELGSDANRAGRKGRKCRDKVVIIDGDDSSMATAKHGLGVDNHPNVVNDGKGKGIAVVSDQYGNYQDMAIGTQVTNKNRSKGKGIEIHEVIGGSSNQPVMLTDKGKGKAIEVDGFSPRNDHQMMTTTTDSEMLGKLKGVRLAKGTTQQSGARKQKSNKSDKDREKNAKTRKENRVSAGQEKQSSKSSAVKKSEVDWNQNLHHKFLQAIGRLGEKNCNPKKILDLMNEPNLTQQDIASHLQSYKSQVRRLSRSLTTKSFQGMYNYPYSSRFGVSQVLEMAGSVRTALERYTNHNVQKAREESLRGYGRPTDFLYTEEHARYVAGVAERKQARNALSGSGKVPDASKLPEKSSDGNKQVASPISEDWPNMEKFLGDIGDVINELDILKDPDPLGCSADHQTLPQTEFDNLETLLGTYSADFTNFASDDIDRFCEMLTNPVTENNPKQ